MVCQTSSNLVESNKAEVAEKKHDCPVTVWISEISRSLQSSMNTQPSIAWPSHWSSSMNSAILHSVLQSFLSLLILTMYPVSQTIFLHYCYIYHLHPSPMQLWSLHFSSSSAFVPFTESPYFRVLQEHRQHQWSVYPDFGCSAYFIRCCSVKLKILHLMSSLHLASTCTYCVLIQVFK